jgi:hypothetical protein
MEAIFKGNSPFKIYGTSPHKYTSTSSKGKQQFLFETAYV